MKKLIIILLSLLPVALFAQTTYNIRGPINQVYKTGAVNDTSLFLLTGDSATWKTTKAKAKVNKPFYAPNVFINGDSAATRAYVRSKIGVETDPVWLIAEPNVVTRQELGDTATVLRNSYLHITEQDTTNWNAAWRNGTSLVDDIFDFSTNKYTPYTSKQSGLNFYTGTTSPTGLTRLNLNGALHTSFIQVYADMNQSSAMTLLNLTPTGTTLNVYSQSNAYGIMVHNQKKGIYLLNESSSSTGIEIVNTYANGTPILIDNPSQDIKLDGSGNITCGKYCIYSLNSAPSSSSDTGTLGEIRYTSDYIYVCVATNTWKRVAISTW